jgi:hypothetical protein
MNWYPDGIEQTASLQCDVDLDFAGCTGSLGCLRGRVLAAAYRASAKRRACQSVVRSVVLLVGGGLLAACLPALADSDDWRQGNASVAHICDSEWDLVDSFVRFSSRHSQILTGRDLSGRESRVENASDSVRGG